MLLGWLQRRRFEQEATARGRTLESSQGMLGAALRLALAAGIAAGLGLIARGYAMQWLPGVHFATILLRATLLCTFGIAAYAILARLFGVREVARFEDIALHRLRLRR
jgi:putative peptidoglycan lipid II flippase